MLFCRSVVLVCGFCAVRLACVVCLKEMAFNKETKKKRGSSLSQFEDSWKQKCVESAFKRDGFGI